MVYAPCERMAGYGAGSRSPESNYYEHELAVARLDGGSVRQLTDNEHFEKYPSWSPDGTQIAFVSSGETPNRLHEWNDVHLYSIAADGTEVRRIAEGPLVHETPQWSPDGERIAYAKFDGEGLGTHPAIYVVGADGRGARRLTDAASGPSWSPDGERIAYAKVDGDKVALYTIAADGTDARRLATITGWQRPGKQDLAKAWISKVSWSPDGSKILVLPGLQIIGADGSDHAIFTVLTPLPDSTDDVTWSPDGTRIAMVGVFRAWGRLQDYDPAAQIALVTIAANGTDSRVLVGIQVEESVVSRPLKGNPVGLVAKRGDISAEVAACGDGVVVPDPEANPGLVEDCETLLEVQNALAGPRGLDWHVDRSISEWEGVVVEGAPPRVREIVLRSRSLGGEIPTELSELRELRVLDMSRNALMGEIPAELGKLKNLERLDLSYNYLSGDMPAELGKLSQLTYLVLGINNLIGEIPMELGELEALVTLSLGINRLRGQIPAELSQLGELKTLDLGGNRLTGEVPAELGQLGQLRLMNLAGNQLTGAIPVELGRLTDLEWLYLSFNQLAGEIPAELGQLAKLKVLKLYRNQLTGAIPAELGQLANLRQLLLQQNRLTGMIPPELGNLTELRYLLLPTSDSGFTGCVPGGLREIRDTNVGDLGLPDCE